MEDKIIQKDGVLYLIKASDIKAINYTDKAVNDIVLKSRKKKFVKFEFINLK